MSDDTAWRLLFNALPPERAREPRDQERRSGRVRSVAAGAVGDRVTVLQPGVLFIIQNAQGRRPQRPPQGGRDKVTGAARYIDDLSFPGPAARAHDPLDDSRRRDRRHPLQLRHRPASPIVDYRDIPGRNIVALIDDDQPCLAERDDPSRRRADPAAGARGSRARCARPTSQIDYRDGDAELRSRGVAARRSRRSRSTRATSTRGFAAADVDRRRRVSRPAIRSSSTSSRTA